MIDPRRRRKRSRASDSRPRPSADGRRLRAQDARGWWSGQVCRRGRSPMDELLCLERCAACASLFSICRPCFHGQIYCGDRCRLPARKAQARAARATYQRSSRGRLVRSARRCELPTRAGAINLGMDQGTEIVAPTSSVCLPQGPPAPMSGVREVGGRSLDDDPLPPRYDVSGEFTADTEEDAPREARPERPTTLVASGPRCAVCRCRGRVVSAWPPRRPRPTHRRGPPRRRGGPVRAPEFITALATRSSFGDLGPGRTID